MKIAKINSLKNVGILDEMTYKKEFALYKTEIKDGKTNIKHMSKVLIRGDNGTGKSTLSNVFRSIEEQEKSNEIIDKIKKFDNDENLQIEIELDNGTILKYDNMQKKWINAENVNIRVFNEDYIKENLNLEEFNQNKIDGKYETKEIEISIEKKEYEESKKKINSIIEEGKNIAKELADKIKDTNDKIRKDLDQYCTIETSIDKYNELNDEKLYKEKKEELEGCINGFRKLKSSDTFNSLKVNNFVNSIDSENLNELLQYTEDNNKISFVDQFLKMSVEKKGWMDVGISYIEDNKCPFCKNDISKNDFVNEYIKYSTSKSKKVEENLLKYKKELENYKNNILRDIKISILKNKEYSDIVDIGENISDEEWSQYINDIESLINAIEKKLKDVSKKLDQDMLNVFQEKLKTIQIIIDKSNKIDRETEKINKVMSNAKKELTSLRQKIKNLYKEILEYAMRENLMKRNQLLKELVKEKENNKEKKQRYDKKVEDADITIKEMNTWLSFFGMGKYKVDKNFNLIYKDNNISNKIFILSTGEISALAFSYYLATLVTGLTNDEKNNLIIIIDDPVNSLDYNKIYSFATAVKIIQKKINENNNPQLIIFTHNMLFFNILVQTNWMKNKNAKVFELYKENEISKIKETKNYKDSLFVTQLSEIIKCANDIANNITIEKSYLYNDIRSVIENLCYLLNPKYVDNDDKYSVLKELFDISSEDFMKLDYIVNNNSHNEPMLNIEKWFDSEILHEACIVISNMIHAKFSKLYDYCINFNNEEN